MSGRDHSSVIAHFRRQLSRMTTLQRINSHKLFNTFNRKMIDLHNSHLHSVFLSFLYYPHLCPSAFLCYANWQKNFQSNLHKTINSIFIANYRRTFTELKVFKLIMQLDAYLRCVYLYVYCTRRVYLILFHIGERWILGFCLYIT